MPSASIAALVGHLADEGAKAGAYLTETLLDPKIGPSGKPDEAPVTTAYIASQGFRSGLQDDLPLDKSNLKLDVWSMLDVPGQEKRLKRFNLSMEGAKRSEPPDVILKGIPKLYA